MRHIHGKLVILLALVALPMFGATGDITALRIVGATSTVADAASACTNATGLGCNGYVLEVDITGLASGGTYALGIGAGNDVSAANVVCTVTGSGYDATGTLLSGTVTRTLYGTHQLRRVYNASYYSGGSLIAPIPNDETVVSSTITVRVGLTDAVYTGETLTCNVAAGIYTNGTASNSVSAMSVTNGSTLTYAQIRAIAEWSWPGWTRITSTSLTVEAVGFQRYGQNGKPLAAMKFLACDATVSVGGACSGHQATAIATAMTIDGTANDLGGKVQRYAATLNLTGFTQGALVRTDFVAYPWVGDATSTMDTTDGVNTAPSPLYSPQFYVYDNAGTYGSPVSVVDASLNIPGIVTSGVFVAGEVVTQNGGVPATAHLISVPGGSGPLHIGAIEGGTIAGTVSLTWTGGTSGAVFTQTVFTATTNTNTTASVGLDSNACAGVVGTNPATLNPCATIRGAAIKIRVINVNNNAAAHSDVNGTIYLKAGYYEYAGISTAVTASSGTNADAEWVTTTPYPGVLKTDVILLGTTSGGNRAGVATTKQKISGVTILMNTGTPNISAGSYMWIDNNALTMTAGTALATGTAGGLIYYTSNVIGTGGVKAMVATSSSVYPALIRGNDLSLMASTVHIYTMLGNLKAPTGTISTGNWITNDSISPASNAPILAYNKNTNYQAGANLFTMFGSQTDPIGAAVIGNLFEENPASAGAAGATAFATGNPAGGISNQMYWHNDFVGGRMFWAYNDGTTSAGVTGCLARILWSDRGNIFESTFNKTDTFATQNANRVCNWHVNYGVGAAGSVNTNSAISAGNPVGLAAGMISEWTGIKANTPAIRASQNLQATAAPPTNTSYNAINWIAFTNRAGFDGINPGAGNGDYHLLGTSPALNQIPAGFAVLPFDIDGTARSNTGSGAAGAYEATATGSAPKHKVIGQ